MTNETTPDAKASSDESKPTSRFGSWLALAAGTAATIPILLWVLSPAAPLGVPNEWVWNRSSAPPTQIVGWAFPVLAAILYIGVVLAGWSFLKRSGHWAWLCLPALLATAAIWQYALASFPNAGLGMERWPSSVYWPSTSGYFTIASEVDDLPAFLRDYDEWIATQDSFHVGTHPPGLIILSRWWLDFFRNRPRASEQFLDFTPTQISDGMSILPDTQRRDPVGLAAIVALIMTAWTASLLVAPAMYALVRTTGSAEEAWVAAAIWPLAPASLLFVPVGDCLYPLLAVLSFLATVWAIRMRTGFLAILAGMLCWVGLMLSLAFLVVAGITALTITCRMLHAGERLIAVWLLICLATGVLLPSELAYESVGLDVIEIWRTNLAKHSGFYEAMPRSYFPWIGINLIEFAAMTGPVVLLGASLWALRRLGRWEAAALDDMVLSWFVLLVVLDISGRNLSEAARLWLFLAPMSAVGAARWMCHRFGATDFGIACAIVLGVEAILAIVLYGWVEPLLPIVAPRAN